MKIPRIPKRADCWFSFSEIELSANSNLSEKLSSIFPSDLWSPTFFSNSSGITPNTLGSILDVTEKNMPIMVISKLNI